VGDLAQLDALIEARIDLRLKCDEGLTVRRARATIGKALALAFGTGSGHANQVYWDLQNILPSGTYTRDLRSDLSNPLGGDCDFTAIRALVLHNVSHIAWPLWEHTPTDAPIAFTAGNWTGPLVAAGDKIVLPPRGIFIATAPGPDGWPVNGEAYSLAISNQSPTEWCLYQIALVGET